MSKHASLHALQRCNSNLTARLNESYQAVPPPARRLVSSCSVRALDRVILFPMARVSKWVTAWGVMRLVQEGTLDPEAATYHSIIRLELQPHE